MREVRAGCDQCEWGGESSIAAKQHHVQTGHTTWCQTLTVTFYGDPVTEWMKDQGMTSVATSRNEVQP